MPRWAGAVKRHPRRIIDARRAPVYHRQWTTLETAMANAQPRRWETDAFLRWEAEQPVRHELVDGTPVMMTGGTQAHTQIKVNLIAWLKPALRGSACRPTDSDLKIPIPNGNIRYPDAAIDCGERQQTAQHVSKPVVIFEILSRSTAYADQHGKLADYRRIPSLMHYVLIWQERPNVVVWSRSDGRWLQGEDIDDLDGAIVLDAAALSIPLRDLYDEVEFGAVG